jgi:hypothetical protein
MRLVSLAPGRWLVNTGISVNKNRIKEVKWINDIKN